MGVGPWMTSVTCTMEHSGEGFDPRIEMSVVKLWIPIKA
jgi:hypothetical protein